MKIILIIVGLGFFVGCSDHSPDYLTIDYYNQDTLYTDSVNYFDFTEKSVDTFIRNIEYIYLQSVPKSYLDRISKVKIDSNHIFIGTFYENSGIYIFNREGNFEANISQFGRGPGEISDITDFTVDRVNKLLYIGEGGNRRISVFDFRGNFVRAMHTSFSFYKMAYSPELHKYIFYTPHDQKKIDGSRIKITDATLNVISKAFPMDLDKIGLHVGFEGRFLVDNNNQVYYNPIAENKIYSISYNGEIYSVLNIEDSEVRDKHHTTLMGTKEPKVEDMLKFKTGLLIDRFIIDSNRFCVRINKEGNPFILVGEMDSGHKKFYKPTIKLTNVGDRFDFIFLEPKAMFDGQLIGFLNAESYIRLLDAVEDENTISHLKKIDPSDNPVLVLYSER